MDHYRLLSTISRRCVGRLYVQRLLKSAYPPIDESSAKLFEPLEMRATKMFFLRRELEGHFNDRLGTAIGGLLRCPCEQCRDGRGDRGGLNPAASDTYIDKIQAREAWLLLPIMLYLGRLHFIYPWLDSMPLTGGPMGSEPVSLDSIGSLDALFPDPLEMRLFREVYDRTWRMFHPVVFDAPPRGKFKPIDYPRHYRFPFQNEEKPETQGQFGSIVRFEIPGEYVTDPVKNGMREYHDAVTGSPDARKYCFVRKVIRSTSLEAGMEDEVLRMVSTLESDNIIKLMAMYTCGTNIHFVFPHVAANLDGVLRGAYTPPGRAGKSDPLPESWLWKEMVGVAAALNAIHTQIENPFPRSRGRVIAFHFDLKPENILVTHAGKLKITDFGQSVIQFVGEDEQPSTSYTLGDPKYMAPESWSGDGTMNPGAAAEPKDIMVLLNYDVWSLACIMLEVLIFWLDTASPSPLAAFDAERNAEKPEGTFFTRTAVKACVGAKIAALRASSVAAEPSSVSRNNYLESVFGLLLEMFCFAKKDRPFAGKVSDRLINARERYDNDRQGTGELLHDQIRKEMIDGGQGYREIGWWDGGRLRSFLDIDTVTVDQTCRRTNNPCGPAEECQIQLLYKPRVVSGNKSAARFVLKWGLKQASGRDKPIRGCIIPTDKGQLAPSYLYRKDSKSKHECALFDQFEGPIPFSAHVLTLGFESRQHAQAFQEALLHCSISPPSGAINALQTNWTPFETQNIFQLATKLRQKKPITASLVTSRHAPIIQLWTKRLPNYYPPPPVQSGNSSPPAAPDAMVLYETDRVMILPLNKRDKKFSSRAPGQVTVSPNRDYRHAFFRAAVTARESPWDQILELTNRWLAAPNLALREDQRGFGGKWLEVSRDDGRELRVQGLEIWVGRDEDVKRIEAAVRGEWV